MIVLYIQSMSDLYIYIYTAVYVYEIAWDQVGK